MTAPVLDVEAGAHADVDVDVHADVQNTHSLIRTQFTTAQHSFHPTEVRVPPSIQFFLSEVFEHSHAVFIRHGCF